MDDFIDRVVNVLSPTLQGQVVIVPGLDTGSEWRLYSEGIRAVVERHSGRFRYSLSSEAGDILHGYETTLYRALSRATGFLLQLSIDPTRHFGRAA